MVRHNLMQTLKAGGLYFVLVFGAGFGFGTIRTLWIVPRIGTRMAELTETPIRDLSIEVASQFVDLVAQKTNWGRVVFYDRDETTPSPLHSRTRCYLGEVVPKSRGFIHTSPPYPKFRESRHLLQRATTAQKVNAINRPTTVTSVIVISTLCALNLSRAETSALCTEKCWKCGM